MKSRHLFTILKNKPKQKPITKKYSGLTSIKISIEVLTNENRRKIW